MPLGYLAYKFDIMVQGAKGCYVCKSSHLLVFVELQIMGHSAWLLDMNWRTRLISEVSEYQITVNENTSKSSTPRICWILIWTSSEIIYDRVTMRTAWINDQIRKNIYGYSRHFVSTHIDRTFTFAILYSQRNFVTFGVFIVGHKYDKNGNLRDWWSPLSLKNFEEKTKCFAEQYNKFTLLGESVRIE